MEVELDDREVHFILLTILNRISSLKEDPNPEVFDAELIVFLEGIRDKMYLMKEKIDNDNKDCMESC